LRSNFALGDDSIQLSTQRLRLDGFAPLAMTDQLPIELEFILL
jgi:hypothetical protein